MNNITIPAYPESPSFALLSEDGFIISENITEKELFDLINGFENPDSKFGVEVWNGEKWVRII